MRVQLDLIKFLPINTELNDHLLFCGCGVPPLKNGIRQLIINYRESLTGRPDDEIPIMINIFR